MSKRVAVLVLVLLIAGLGVYGWQRGTIPSNVLWPMGFGVAAGLLYLLRGGSLPRAIHWLSFPASITENHDPSNIPPRIYIPILIAAILIALVATVVYLR